MNFEINEVVRVKEEGKTDRVRITFLLGKTHGTIEVERPETTESIENYTMSILKKFETAIKLIADTNA